MPITKCQTKTKSGIPVIWTIDTDEFAEHGERFDDVSVIRGIKND